MQANSHQIDGAVTCHLKSIELIDLYNCLLKTTKGVGVPDAQNYNILIFLTAEVSLLRKKIEIQLQAMVVNITQLLRI